MFAKYFAGTPPPNTYIHHSDASMRGQRGVSLLGTINQPLGLRVLRPWFTYLLVPLRKKMC